MRRGFTLVELLLSIMIFSIVALFLFQTIELQKRSTKTVVQKSQELVNRYNMQEVITNDILYASAVNLKKDREGNTKLFLTTKQNFENTFNDKVLYLLTREKRLYRVESDKKITHKNIHTLKPTNIHLIYKDVSKFKVSPVKYTRGLYAFYIKFEDGEQTLFASAMF